MKGNLSSDVFGRRTSTGNVLVALLSRDFEHIREKTHNNITNFVASRHIARKKGSLPVDMRRSKTSLPKLPKDGDSG